MARGGRRDEPIDRSSGPLAEFVDDLRRLRGETSLEEVGRRIGYHPSTVSRRLKPVELPPWHFVEAYVRACGADPASWRPRWEALAAAGRTAPAANGVAAGGPVAAPAPGRIGEEPAPRRGGRRILLGAVAVAAAACGVTLVLVRVLGGQAVVMAAPAAPPPAVEPGFGFSAQIKYMAFQVFSRHWTQPASGDVELWWNNSCAGGSAGYWVKLEPAGETVQFGCGSWHHHRWTGVPAGTYHLRFWKANDGRVVRGSGVLRTSVPVVVHPKAEPSGSATPEPGATTRPPAVP